MYYFTGKPCKRGHVAKRLVSTHACTECLKAHSKAHYETNKEQYAVDSAAWAKNNPERVKAIQKRYLDANTEKVKADHLEWARKNRQALAAKTTARECKKLQRTPPWADLTAIREFYKSCPEGHHVDHAVPLQAVKASGLHVLENLQYLPAAENISKRNKFEPC